MTNEYEDELVFTHTLFITITDKCPPEVRAYLEDCYPFHKGVAEQEELIWVDRKLWLTDKRKAEATLRKSIQCNVASRLSCCKPCNLPWSDDFVTIEAHVSQGDYLIKRLYRLPVTSQ